MKGKLLLVAFCLIGMISYATKPKITKERDHWGIFGGFEKVTVCKDYVVGPDGTKELASANITCTGSGEATCPAKSSVSAYYLDNTTLEELQMTEPEFNLAIAMMEKAEELLDDGDNEGNFKESVTIMKPDGVIEVCIYEATWFINSDGKAIISVQKQ